MTNKQLAQVAGLFFTILLFMSWYKFGMGHPVSLIFATLGLPCHILGLVLK